MPLINWHWLEDLLVRACEVEIRAFGQRHPEERFFAFCVEFDGIDGSLRLSYGTHDAVEAAARESRRSSPDDPLNYRSLELQPRNWKFRWEPRFDPEGHWSRMAPLLDQYAELMAEDREPEEAEFYWLRLEFLAECAVRRLIDRDAFRHLWREEEFLAYPFCSEERLEELEDRIEKLYPAYQRATAEWAEQPRPGDFHAGRCEGTRCGKLRTRASLVRCTHCQAWFCDQCRPTHLHPELAQRRPLFM